MLKASGFEELWPLLPLTKGGATQQVVEEMASELLARGREDLLEVGLFCASLVLKSKFERRWLTERYHDMLQDFIEDSWIYEEGLEKGLQRAQQTAIRIVVARFPQLRQLAEEIIEKINDANRLQVLAIELSVVSSQEQAKDLLLSLVSAA
ncbi:MAG TPA: hypothetical protein VN207_05960 [Ktedonobacteraceae bacterium]|nr:hypothetical protein [Ktedonobacteraceae bacterium]